jgi:GntR family transcriptional regulator, phosphonate transport system regulatory protein
MDEAFELEPQQPRGGATAWRRIVDRLTDDFSQGRFASGESLPAAQDLARRFGVHRHTVRQAYKHLETMGLVQIRQGSGTFYTGDRMTYRLGRRVRLRENFQAQDLVVVSRVLDIAMSHDAGAMASDLGLAADAPVWVIDVVNILERRAVSTGRHWLSRDRFPDFPDRLAANMSSFTATFAANGIPDYERRSTRIRARAATKAEALRLGLSCGAAVLTTRGVDVEPAGGVLQIVEAVFNAESVEFLVGDGL